MKSLAGIVVLSALVLACGCVKHGKFTPSAESGTGWEFHRGGVESMGADSTDSFGGKLKVIWRRKQNDKAIGPLTLSGGGLFYPSSRKKIKVFDPATGETLAQIKSRGPAQSGAVRVDTLLYFGVGPLRNRLVSYNLRRGKEVRETVVKDVSGGSIIVQNRLIIGSAENRLASFDLSNGREVWSIELSGRAVAPPSFDGTSIFQPTDDGKLYAIRLEDGSTKFRADMGSPILGSVACGELVWVAGFDGEIRALDPGDGRIVWQTMVGGPIWSAPAVADGIVFVANSAGSIAALDAKTGAPLWRYEAVAVIRSAPLIVGNVLLAATMTGKLLSLSAETGALLDTLDLEGPVRYAPISSGDRVYIATENGRITCVGDDHASNATSGNASTAEHRP